MTFAELVRQRRKEVLDMKYEQRTEQKIIDRMNGIKEEVGMHLGAIAAENDGYLEEFELSMGNTGYIYDAVIEGHTYTGVIDFDMPLLKMVLAIWDDIQNNPVMW